MATVFEEYIIEKKSFVVSFFLWARGLSANDIHKEMFPACVMKCLSLRAVHNWVTNVSLMAKRLKRRCGSG
jgi:hypothetical protein